MPGVQMPATSSLGEKLSNEKIVSIKNTSACAASSSAFSTSAIALLESPVTVSDESISTPSPRKSGNTHQRMTLVPFDAQF